MGLLRSFFNLKQLREDYDTGGSPESEKAAAEALALPSYPEREPEMQEWIEPLVSMQFEVAFEVENCYSPLL